MAATGSDDRTLGIHAQASATSTVDSVEAFIEGFKGAGTHGFTYDDESEDFNWVSVDLAGGYLYKFFYDFSREDFHEEYSHCTLNVMSFSATAMTGTLECSDLISDSLSADYEDDPEEFQPRVSIDMSFACKVG